MKQHFKTSLFLLPFFLSFMVPVSAFDGAGCGDSDFHCC